MPDFDTSVVGLPSHLRLVLTQEQISRRIAEMGRQITGDFSGRSPVVVAVLDNAAVFAADLIRHLQLPLQPLYIKPQVTERKMGPNVTTEIFFAPEMEVRGEHVILLEGLVESGVTTDFLMRNLHSRGAATVKLAAFLDRQTSRRISLQPDYFGFLIDEMYVVGYGLGAPTLGRNLPFVAATTSKATAMK